MIVLIIAVRRVRDNILPSFKILHRIKHNVCIFIAVTEYANSKDIENLKIIAKLNYDLSMDLLVSFKEFSSIIMD